VHTNELWLNSQEQILSNDLPTVFVKWREIAADRINGVLFAVLKDTTKETPTSSRQDI
jgi:hypothetical protein